MNQLRWVLNDVQLLQTLTAAAQDDPAAARAAGALVALLAGATGLRALRLSTSMDVRSLGQCGVLSQLTSLEVLSPARGPFGVEDVDAVLLGLTALQRLCLGFQEGMA